MAARQLIRYTYQRGFLSGQKGVLTVSQTGRARFQLTIWFDFLPTAGSETVSYPVPPELMDELASELEKKKSGGASRRSVHRDDPLGALGDTLEFSRKRVVISTKTEAKRYADLLDVLSRIASLGREEFSKRIRDLSEQARI